MNANGNRVSAHFENLDASVKETYNAILRSARELGPVKEDPKKTSIHLVRKTAFAGIATRKAGLILTLKSASDIANKRIARREQTSAHRWHLEIKLNAPSEVDKEIFAWLKQAYDLAG